MHRLDVAKGALIILVVLGHLLEATAGWEARTTRLPLTAIYMFHMPAFVFLAGITAKSTQLPRRIGVFLVLLVVFQTLYFFAVPLLGLERTFSLVRPFWILWFLLAMCWWQLLTPLISKFPKTSVGLSFLIASMSGIFESIGYDFTFSRAVVFLPFFVVGATHGQVILRTAGRIAVQWKIAGVVALAGAWLYLYYRDTRPGWLYGSFSFERLDTQDPQGVLFRIGLLFIASAAIFVFLSLMPDKDGMPAMLGRRSLAIYLMHGFVVLAITPYLPLILDQTNSIVAFVAAVLLTMLTVALFALPVFDQLIRWFSQFIVRQISKPLVLAYQRLWEPRN